MIPVGYDNDNIITSIVLVSLDTNNKIQQLKGNVSSWKKTYPAYSAVIHE